MWIVVYDDGDCIHLPYGEDPQCEGALIGYDEEIPIKLFEKKSEARKAIRISRKFAELCKLQGNPVNEDFLDGMKHVRVTEITLG